MNGRFSPSALCVIFRGAEPAPGRPPLLPHRQTRKTASTDRSRSRHHEEYRCACGSSCPSSSRQPCSPSRFPRRPASSCRRRISTGSRVGQERRSSSRRRGYRRPSGRGKRAARSSRTPSGRRWTSRRSPSRFGRRWWCRVPSTSRFSWGSSPTRGRLRIRRRISRPSSSRPRRLCR